jgi:hypothetical protein
MYLQCFACKVRYLDRKNLFGSVGKRGVDLFDILLLLLFFFFFPLKCYGWEKLLSTNDLAFNLHTFLQISSCFADYLECLITRLPGETNLCSSSAPIWTIWHCHFKAAASSSSSSSSSSSQWGVSGLRKFRFKDLHVCLQNFCCLQISSWSTRKKSWKKNSTPPWEEGMRSFSHLNVRGGDECHGVIYNLMNAQKVLKQPEN